METAKATWDPGYEEGVRGGSEGGNRGRGGEEGDHEKKLLRTLSWRVLRRGRSRLWPPGRFAWRTSGKLRGNIGRRRRE